MNWFSFSRPKNLYWRLERLEVKSERPNCWTSFKYFLGWFRLQCRQQTKWCTTKQPMLLYSKPLHHKTVRYHLANTIQKWHWTLTVKLQNMETVNTALAWIVVGTPNRPSAGSLLQTHGGVGELWVWTLVGQVGTLPDFLHWTVSHHNIETCGHSGGTKWMICLSPLLISIKHIFQRCDAISAMSIARLSSMSVVQ